MKEMGMNRLDRIKGCLLGGAVGDALGAPVEFLGWADIKARFGAGGITEFAPAYGIKGAVTDDTQMMLFTAEGLLRAFVRGSSRGICHVPSVIHHALLRWLLTQDYAPVADVRSDGWLIKNQALWSRRAPGNTCIQSLRVAKRFGEPAQNDSKGCGAVMRVAPCAFFGNAFEYASESGRLTHGHPSGYLAAGIFADILQRIVEQAGSLEHALTESLARYGSAEGMDEVRVALERVLFFFYEGFGPTPERIAQFGGGWVAEEALAIGVWCALFAGSLQAGVVMAVNHDGDSDSTGLIAGHLLGALYGAGAIPEDWYGQLELREVIERVAEDIERVPRDFCGMYGEFDAGIVRDYPGD
jgi:ADP-ribosylglycohydrolase